MKKLELIGKLESTAGNIKEGFIFNHLVITQKELYKILAEHQTLEEYARLTKSDFISLQKKGEVNFFHTSYIENEESILTNGLLVGNDNWIGDLGKGIYAIDPDNIKAESNLSDYNSEEEELLIIKGVYNGEYTECIFGWQHEGYLVLKNNIASYNLSDVYVTQNEDL